MDKLEVVVVDHVQQSARKEQKRRFRDRLSHFIINLLRKGRPWTQATH